MTWNTISSKSVEKWGEKDTRVTKGKISVAMGINNFDNKNTRY